jgi:hypothetical protein
MIRFFPGYFGWLGNQMFQYAATFAASKRVGVDCEFPENEPNLFDIFNLSASRNTLATPLVYQEPTFEYKPIPKKDGLTLFGYFQSERYFDDFADDIRKEFTFKDSIDSTGEGVVAVHVRRGDYTTLQDHHPLCTLDYYKRAMDMFEGHSFLVFSDDIDWCRENIKGPKVMYSEENSAARDLQLMASCDHNIIANSSFSWWGAWLNENQDKKVVAPKQWFGSAKPLETRDIYCKDWITL